MHQGAHTNHITDAAGSFDVPEPWRPMWMALCEDGGACVHVVNQDGVILFANEVARCAAAPGRTRAEAGRRLAEVWEDDLARERHDLVRQVAQSGRPLAMEGMIQGRLIRSTFRSLGGEDGKGAVLIVSVPASLAGAPKGVVVRARFNDAGPLARLTTRELEILRLIGEGLSTSEIAERLHRSVKTVEWHRVSLGNKLGVTNRVELARIAIGAGLVELAGTREPG